MHSHRHHHHTPQQQNLHHRQAQRHTQQQTQNHFAKERKAPWQKRQMERNTLHLNESHMYPLDFYAERLLPLENVPPVHARRVG